ncbi:MAG TPA: DUF2800 domain-containing protein [Clostridia bacterium]|nr:DUF2800 domain-containing protein [Clostridia bacterium]
MSAPEEHALLSASGAHKWLHCSPSARLEETLPESTSDYAEEGRLAHAIGELKLRKHFTPMGPKKFAAELKTLQGNKYYTSEMDEHTTSYLEFVQGVVHSFPATPHVALERKLDYSHVAPEGFGTGDCIVIGSGILHVIDLKYGKGVPVSAEENPQMMLYALGALKEYAMLYPVDEVRMSIVQPRLGEPSTWKIGIASLVDWAQNIAEPAAQLAFAGKGEYRPGDWCRFCRAKAKCRARNEEYSETVTALEAFAGARPPLITNDELGAILRRAIPIAAWVEDLQKFALAAILNGDAVPGWKAVEGRSNRQFADVDAAFKALMEAGYEEALLYKREPITLTAVETLTGKPKFAELLGSFVTKPQGKPTLADETDKREPFKQSPTAAEVFTNG